MSKTSLVWSNIFVKPVYYLSKNCYNLTLIITYCLMKNRKFIICQLNKPWSRLLGGLAIIGGLGYLTFALAPVAYAQPTAGSQQQAQIDCRDEQGRHNVSRCQGLQTIDTVLNFMALLVLPLCGIIITVAGIQYIIARNNPEMIKSARMRIYKVVLALVIFVFLWTFLKWLIPGGTLEWDTW